MYGDTFRVAEYGISMCGITGYCLSSTGGPVDSSALVRRMTRVRWRIGGPDDEGIHVEPGVGLGHRRLAILDLSLRRPPTDGDAGLRSLWITYNGEIYNFRELRRALEQQGHFFLLSQSDTEVLLYAYRQWGEKCWVSVSTGFFAFGFVGTAPERALDLVV